MEASEISDPSGRGVDLGLDLSNSWFSVTPVTQCLRTCFSRYDLESTCQRPSRRLHGPLTERRGSKRISCTTEKFCTRNNRKSTIVFWVWSFILLVLRKRADGSFTTSAFQKEASTNRLNGGGSLVLNIGSCRCTEDQNGKKFSFSRPV